MNDKAKAVTVGPEFTVLVDVTVDTVVVDVEDVQVVGLGAEDHRLGLAQAADDLERGHLAEADREAGREHGVVEREYAVALSPCPNVPEDHGRGVGVAVRLAVGRSSAKTYDQHCGGRYCSHDLPRSSKLRYTAN